ncbi:hypothetical protein, partial [Leptospira borgpetersenii]
AFLWVALKNSMQSFPMGRSEKLNAELSYGSLCRSNLFHGGLSEEIQVIVGKVMALYGSA